TLEAEGRIYRRQGLGSFVAPPKTPQGLVRLTDFAQDMIRAGLNASSQVLHHAPEPAPADVAEALALPADPSGTPPYVVRLDRLRLASGEPLALDRTWLPPFYAQLLEGHDLARDTIYAVLERHYGIPVLSGRYTIEATLADETLAEALGLEVGRPLLRVVRVSRTAGERVVYVQHRYYRADRVAFELELAREPDQASEEGGMPLREFATVFHRV
ncbi:MAG: GntR family transcriptional regulator, partial [Rubricoccaceae bacterium]